MKIEIYNQSLCSQIVDFGRCRIDYYDSLLNDDNNACLRAISEYLMQESLDTRKLPLDMSKWAIECREDIPHQRNAHDCGMYACMLAEYATRRASITFDQKHIQYFRERMAFEIYRNKFL